ncbi:MAG: P-loop NTPase, partial [Anaerolineales bacterium]|nr:P-loop NTPase [Anaerolineales bacterium]
MAKLRLPSVRNLIIVASGKGGVGKTTVTVNLALALQARGARVGIFDADIYGPNIPVALGIHRREEGNAFVPIMRQPDALPYIDPLERYGLQLMSTGLLVSEAQVINPLADTVGQLAVRTLRDVKWGQLDYLLLDLPPSAGQPQQSLLQFVHFDGAIV